MSLNNPNRKIRPKEKPFYGQMVDQYKFLKVGKITRVDNEKGFVSLIWLDDVGGKAEVPIASPYASPRSFLGGMPEVGSVAVCGFSKQTQTTGKAQILHYLGGGYESALKFFLDHGNYSDEREFVVEADYTNATIDTLIEEKVNHGITRYKRRKIYPGDIQGESSAGSEIYLSDDLQLINSRLNEIELRAADQRIISNSLNNTIITGGAKITNGLISRNLKSDYTAFKASDNLDDFLLRRHMILPNGKRYFTITADQKELDFTDTESLNQVGGGAFTEIRTELKELTSGVLNVTEETADTDIDTFSKPYLTTIMGTNVGNDPTNTSTYGRVLRPQIFANEEDAFPSVGDEVVTGGAFRSRSVATAFELKFNHNGNLGVERTAFGFSNRTKFSIDKQGHTFINLSASTTDHPLGAGRSLEFNADGSLKMVIGANKNNGESMLLNTLGGVRVDLGENINRNSMELTMRGAYKLNILGKDEDNFSYISEINGDVKETIRGNKTLNIDGSYKIVANGVIDEQIRGTKLETYVNDKTVTYGGNYTGNILGKIENNISEAVVENISGDVLFPANLVKATNIISGTQVESIKIGDKKVTLNKGNSEENITIGNKTVNITTGNYALEIGTGAITINTAIGSVKISGSTDVEITGLNVKTEATKQNEVRAGVKAIIDALAIELGEGATQPAVLGYKLLAFLASHTHLDPISGTTGPASSPPSFDMLSTITKLK